VINIDFLLCVEDDPSNRLVMKLLVEKTLNARDYAIFGDSADFIPRVQSLPACPDIILLDLNLPRLGGLEVLAAIKSDDSMKSIPVIIMSSSKSEADVSAAYRLNANCYTQKPLEIDRFFNVMENIRRFWLETAILPDIPAGKVH